LIILGVDPGSLITGYALLRCEGNRHQVIDAGPIRLKKFGELPDRLVHLADRLEALIEEFKPQALSIEKVFYGVNFQSALTLGHVRGVVLMLAARNQMSVGEYGPTEVKKAVTGYGRAEKSQVQEMVKILLNLKTIPKPNDVADAMALAICHAHMAPMARLYGR